LIVLPQTHRTMDVKIGENLILNSTDHGELSALVDSIPALVASIDCNMKLRYCNRPFKEWIGFEGDVSGKSFAAITSKNLFRQVQRHMGTVLFGETAHFQISVDTPDGIKYLDATLSPQFDNQKKVSGFIFHSFDVTEKNRTERALKDYFENASIGLHWVDANGTIIWANQAELKMLGYEANEYIGHGISEFHANKNAIEEILTRLSNKQNIQNYEADLLCKDGTIRHVSINSSVLWEGGEFIHTRCFTVDITKEKQGQKAIEESEQRFRMITHLAPLVIWTTDKAGLCNFLSIKWEELTGGPVNEGFGHGWIDFIHAADKDKILQSWKQSLEKKSPFEAKVRLVNKHDESTICLISTTPRFDSNNLFIGYVGVMQDISVHEQIRSSLEKMVLDRTEDIRKKHRKLQKAEKQLLDKNRELELINRQLESFAHVASHDLQEPLRKISIFSNRLFDLDGDKFSDQGKQFHERIRETTIRMQNLIRDLLKFSKVAESGELREPLDLNELFDEVLRELEIKTSDKGARIEMARLPKIRGVRVQFYQLFLNLMSNALKFTNEHRTPVICLKSEVVEGKTIPLLNSDDQFHHIEVSDNGIGFDPASGEKIFEVFHRLNSPSSYEGTGIGLAICKRIIENHGGKITANGKINAGATFHIYLPVANEDTLK
jgi:PAS domain S-box-containing protein